MKCVRKEIWNDPRIEADKKINEPTIVSDDVHETVLDQVWCNTYYFLSYDVIEQIRAKIRDDIK
jgi:hypothetical protein